MIEEKVLDEVVADLRSCPLGEYAQPYHYVIAVRTLMHAAGWANVDYPTLIVESGVGLSFGYKRNACVHMYALQWDAPKRIADATGFELAWKTCEQLEDAWAWVKDSIDRWLPSAAEYGEYHVVAGYREGESIEDRGWYVLANEPIRRR